MDEKTRAPHSSAPPKGVFSEAQKAEIAVRPLHNGPQGSARARAGSPQAHPLDVTHGYKRVPVDELVRLAKELVKGHPDEQNYADAIEKAIADIEAARITKR